MSNIPVYFKEVYTTKVMYYNLDHNWTKSQFMTYIRPLIARDFNINIDNFEIVETGQELRNDDNQLLPSEEAPGIEINNVKLREIWGDSLNVSFYVRKKNDTNVNTSSSLPDYTCVICMNEGGTNYYGCTHNICNICVNSCINANINRCSICRQNIRG